MLEHSQRKRIPPKLFSYSVTQESLFPFLQKICPKDLLIVNLNSWGSSYQIFDKRLYNLLKHSKHTKTLKFTLEKNKDHKFFLQCLKLFYSNTKQVEIQRLNQNTQLKQFHYKFLSPRVQVVNADSLQLSLRLIKTLGSLKNLIINFNSISNNAPKACFNKLAVILKHSRALQTCCLKNIKDKNQALEELENLVTNSRKTIHFIIELNDLPLSNISKLSHLKERITLGSRLTSIDQSLRPENDFSFVNQLDISLRFGFNIKDISNIAFLGYMNNLTKLDLSLRLRDLCSTNLNDLLQIIKLPKQLHTLNLELHDLHFKTDAFQNKPALVLNNLAELKQSIETLKNEKPLSNLINEFEGLKNLKSIRLLFSGDQDSPLFYLFMYTLIGELSSLTMINIILEISRNQTNEEQWYFELNLTYLLAIMQNPQNLTQLLVSVPLIGFRKIDKIPELKSLEKIFLHCTKFTKDPVSKKEHHDYAEKLFEAISETNVRDVYFYFMNDLIGEEWLQTFIETGKFPKIERIFLCSEAENIDVDLFEAVCFLLREKKDLVKMVLNFTKCNVSAENLETCLSFLEENKKLHYSIISVRNGNVVNNKGLKQSSILRL